MYKRVLLNTLIGQEKRAVKVFLVLLLTIITAIDITMNRFFGSGFRIEGLLPFLVMYLLLPAGLVYIRNQNPRIVKYMYFIGYSVTSLLMELILFWQGKENLGGSATELFFLLFSPIFINRRFFWIVTSGTICKYIFLSLLIGTTYYLVPIALAIVLTVVSFIILHRFIGFISTMSDSYLNQFEKVVTGIVSILELKDPYTRGHSQRVAEYTIELARQMDMFGENDLKLIFYACLLHDVGKVNVPDRILSKPSRLTVEEYELIKQHPIVGAQALKDIEGFELCLDVVLYHHEQWDGTGYPEGLKKTQIPLTARIAAIADSFDAMTSERSYRKSMSPEQAYEQIVSGSGNRYDPALVEHFRKVYPMWKDKIENRGYVDARLAIEEAAITR